MAHQKKLTKDDITKLVAGAPQEAARPNTHSTRPAIPTSAIPASAKTQMVRVRWDAAELERVRRHFEREDVSLSAGIRFAVMRYIEGR